MSVYIQVAFAGHNRPEDLGDAKVVRDGIDIAQCPKPPEKVGNAVTRLDGLAAEAEGRNPHLQQTRMIVEASDIVVVVWTGAAAKGAGGTADAVLYALELARPVLW